MLAQECLQVFTSLPTELWLSHGFGSAARDRALWLLIDFAPVRDESLPRKCTTSFTCSRPGRFLCGGCIKCREMTGLFLHARGRRPISRGRTLPFAPRPRDASRGHGQRVLVLYGSLSGVLTLFPSFSEWVRQPVNVIQCFSGGCVSCGVFPSLTYRSRRTRLVEAF